MKLNSMGGFALAALFAGAAVLASAPAAAAPPDHARNAGKSDNLESALSAKQNRLRKQGLEMLLKGQARAKGPNQVVEVAKGQFVELARQGEDNIFTIVAQFGPENSPVAPLQSGIPGPLRNAIPEPDRSKDNTTIWAPDFSPAYYKKMLFDGTPGAVSMRNFYIEQSSGRYAVKGDVTDWVTVPYNAAHYGRNYCGSIVCQQTWRFVQDAANAWYDAQIAAGKTQDQINEYLSQFDKWDRYDHNGNGNFNEPDGYIDHFQIVHAGEGEETGGGAQGSDAIWSHRWAVQYAGGPTLDDGTIVPYGGTRIGQSKYWIRDYTVEPENGGVGVFSHEYGHDLGLPDLYDTSGNTGGASNSVEFWSLYSRGSYGSTGVASEGIGSKPISMSAYEKIFLGWSNYQVVGYGQQASVKMGPASFNTRQTQQLALLLPDKEVVTKLPVSAYVGSYMYFSGAGNSIDNSMTRQVTLPAGAVTLSAKVRYGIERDWDYAYLTVNGTPVATSRSTATNPNGQNFGNGITGDSGGWVDLTADLSAYAGQTVTIGWRYWTDGAEVGSGLLVDDIAITGQALDGAETDPGWSYVGFVRTNGEVRTSHFNAYFAEYRNYRGYDDGLRTGPYNFGFTGDLKDWVEHYHYQDGLLVWYYDTSFEDNNVGDHCAANNCGGLVLPVDAHPALLIRPDGKVWSTGVQSHDSTFGLQATEAFCLHYKDASSCVGGLPANPLFDDRMDYWVTPDPSINNFGWASVPVPKTGTTIRVVNTSAQDNFMQVLVNSK